MNLREEDRVRLDALINGAFAADEHGNVAVTVRDLRWLVCLVDSLIWEIELRNRSGDDAAALALEPGEREGASPPVGQVD